MLVEVNLTTWTNQDLVTVMGRQRCGEELRAGRWPQLIGDIDAGSRREFLTLVRLPNGVIRGGPSCATEAQARDFCDLCVELGAQWAEVFTGRLGSTPTVLYKARREDVAA